MEITGERQAPHTEKNKPISLPLTSPSLEWSANKTTGKKRHGRVEPEACEEGMGQTGILKSHSLTPGMKGGGRSKHGGENKISNKKRRGGGGRKRTVEKTDTSSPHGLKNLL